MSSDPLASAANGITKGTLEWTSEKVKSWVSKFKDKDLAFIEDIGMIKLAKEQRATGEWDFFKTYVKENKLRILFQLGLTLRKLEKNKDYSEIENLRMKIYKKEGHKGLHITQFVQNGFFSVYVGSRLDKATTHNKLKFEIEDLFNNIDQRICFIQKIHQNKLQQKKDEIIAKIRAHSPETFIISSVKSVGDICEKIKEEVMSAISDYEEEIYQAKEKKIFFLNRIEEVNSLAY